MDLYENIHFDNQADGNNSASDVNSGYDFLAEFFDHPSEENELNHAKLFLSADYQAVVDDLTHSVRNPCSNNLQLQDVKKEKISRKKDSSLFTKLSKEKKELEHDNERLKKRIIIQERSIAKYEVKLAQCMTDQLVTKKKLEEARKALKSYEMENTNLKCQVQMSECEVSQYKGLKVINNEENKNIQELERTVSVKMESIRRLKKNSAAHRSQLAENDVVIKKLQHHNQQILNLLVEFGGKLSEAGLLTKNYMLDIMKKYGKECFTLNSSKTMNEVSDLPGFPKTSSRLTEQVDSDHFETCIGDQNVSSSIASPNPSFVSSSEISSSVCKSIETFQNVLHNLPKKKHKSKKKLCDSNIDKLDQNCDFNVLPDTSSNLVCDIWDCDASKQNQSLCSQALVSSKYSRDFTGMDSLDLTASKDESEIFENEDLQNDSSCESRKNIHKKSDSASSTLLEKLIPQSHTEKFNSEYAPSNTSCSVSSLLPNGEEVTSSNSISTVSFQSQLINNLSTKEERPKTLSAPDFSNDTELDRFYGFSPDTVSYEKEAVDPDKQEKIINCEGKIFKTAENSHCSNILMPLSSPRNPVQKGKRESCIKQMSSESTFDVQKSLPPSSIPLIKDSQPGRLNCCITPEDVLKANTDTLKSLVKETEKQIGGESKISDVPIKGTVFGNEISTIESKTNHHKLESDFDNTVSFFQDDQSLPEEGSKVFDEFSKFEITFDMLLNPISPLPPSPCKNKKFFNKDDIFNQNSEGKMVNLQTNQTNFISNSNDDQLLVFEKDQNLSHTKSDLVLSSPSVSSKRSMSETHDNLDIQAKLVDEYNSLHRNLVNPIACEKQNVTSDILCPNVRECYVSLSRCDIPRYFSSIKKQASSEMLVCNQNDCKIIPEGSNLIAACETNDLIQNDSNKDVVNANKMLNFHIGSSQHQAERKKNTLSEEISEDNLKCKIQRDVSIKRQFIDSETTITITDSSPFSLNTSLNTMVKGTDMLECKPSDNNPCDLKKSQLQNLHDPELNSNVSTLNESNSLMNQTHILSKSYVSAQDCNRNDNFKNFHFPHNKSLFQSNKCNKMKYDCLNSSISKFYISSNSAPIENLVGHNNTSVTTNSRTKSDSVSSSNKSFTSKPLECYVSLSRSDVPNYFKNVKNKTPSQLVDYFKKQFINSSSVLLFERKDSLLHDDSKTPAQTEHSDNTQSEIKRVGSKSESERYFEKASNSWFLYDDLLRKPSDLLKMQNAVTLISNQPVVTPSNSSVKNPSLNTCLNSLCVADNFSLTDCENHHKSPERQENNLKGFYPSNTLTLFARDKEISNKILSECHVLLSRNDVPNYFLSTRKRPFSQATEDTKENFSSLQANVQQQNNEQQITDEYVMNDSNINAIDADPETNGNDIYEEINTSAIPIDLENESSSFIRHEILSDKSFSLLRQKSLALRNESDKSISGFHRVTAENSFKSQSLTSIKSCASLFDGIDTSVRINKVTLPVFQKSVEETGEKDLSTNYVELSINNFNEQSFESFKSKNHSVINTHNPSAIVDGAIKGTKPMNEMFTGSPSQNSSVEEFCHKDLSTDLANLPIKQFNRNLSKSSMSENCSLIGNRSLLSCDSINRVDSMHKNFTMTAFQNSPETKTFHEDLSSKSAELCIKSDNQNFSTKRKSSELFSCNFSEKSSLKNWCSDYTPNKPLFEERNTMFLSEPSMSTTCKKTKILNQDSVTNEQKRAQKAVHIPVCPIPEFPKNCSPVIKKPNSLKKKIKPLNNETTYNAPDRVTGRTLESKAFARMSCNNSRDSNSIPIKEAELFPMSTNLEENIGKYVSVKPLKIHKQYKIKSSNKAYDFCNANEGALDLSEHPVSLMEDIQPDANLPSEVPEQPKPTTRSKVFFDFLQKYTSTDNGKAEYKEITQEQLSFNETGNKLKKEETVVTSLGSVGLDSKNFTLTKQVFEQSKEFIDKQLSSNENENKIKFQESKTAVLNAVKKNTKDFKKNKPLDMFHNTNKRSLNSLKQTITSHNHLHSNAKTISELLQHSKQVTTSNVFFDFLQKQTSKKCKTDKIKKLVDKQWSVNDTKTKLKTEGKRLFVNNAGKNKSKNMHKKFNVNKSKIKNENQRLPFNKSEKKLKIENKLKNKQLKIENKLKNESKKCLAAQVPRKGKKQKRAKLKSNEEIKPTASSLLTDVLLGIESTQTSDEQFTHYLDTLTNFLTNPLHSPDLTNLIFHVINFLHLTKENHLINSSNNNSTHYLLPSAESCIVEVLFSIQNDPKYQLQSLIKTILHVLHLLVLTKVKFHIYGLASLTRVLAEICKRNNDKAEALSLCCDILKVNHPFGPYLIASIFAVWRELSVISDNMSEEDILLLRSISFGIQKKPPRLSKSNWNYSFELLTGLVPSVPDVDKAIEFLKNRILVKCLENTFEKLWRLTSPFLILVGQKPWDWIKKHVVDMYLTPNMQRFSRHNSKEEAFNVFCNLCVEVLMLNEELDEEKVLNMFYENLSLTGRNFVRDCVAVSLMKYFISSKRTVPPFLEDWFKSNQENPRIHALENIFQQRLLSEHQEVLSKQDIVI